MRSRMFTRAGLSALCVMVLCAATLTPLAAQQASGSREAADSTAGQASSSSAVLPGPRLPKWHLEQSVEPISGSERAFLAPQGGNTTIVISTLALVIIVVLVALLIL